MIQRLGDRGGFAVRRAAAGMRDFRALDLPRAVEPEASSPARNPSEANVTLASRSRHAKDPMRS
jgi:hypothetical protein